MNGAELRRTDVGFRCPCCGARTLSLPASMELCPVCWWEDDGQDSEDAFDVRGTVNGELSLHEARLNYRQFGAAHPRFVRYVRQAVPEEE
jgi:Cysteine-rich CPCC